MFSWSSGCWFPSGNDCLSNSDSTLQKSQKRTFHLGEIMTSVWIITGKNRYLNAEKIQNLEILGAHYDDTKTIYADISYEHRESIYSWEKLHTSSSPIKHIIRWIYKAKVLASEKKEVIFLDFNKDFDNPIVED